MQQERGTLTAEAVSALLREKPEVLCYPTIDSTNNEAKRLLPLSAGDLLLIAEEQTAGRGRQGKTFYSPAGTGIYFSLVLRSGKALTDTVGITSAAAVAVCRAIEALTDKHPQIKWVNDIYLDGKKIAGILCEAVTDGTQSATAVIIGIGINLTTQEFPADVPNAAALNANLDRAALVAGTVNELYALAAQGYDGFLDAYRRRFLLTGRRITFVQNGVATAATVLGIDERCGLRVRLDSGEAITLRSGEISIRKE